MFSKKCFIIEEVKETIYYIFIVAFWFKFPPPLYFYVNISEFSIFI